MKYEYVVARLSSEKRRCCPFLWDRWIRTNDQAIRQCPNCQETARRCASDQEVLKLVGEGVMVGIRRPMPQEISMLGEVCSGGVEVTSEEEKAIRLFLMANAQVDVLGDLKLCDRECEECGFPIKSYHKSCKVCQSGSDDLRAEIQKVESERRRAMGTESKAKGISLEDRMKKLLKPVWKMRLGAPQTVLPRTGSKFGGLPYLEQGESWPSCPHCHKSQDFICQVDVSDTEVGRKLSIGFFTFFFCWDCDDYGDGDRDQQANIRVYKEASEERLAEVVPPQLEFDIVNPHPERSVTLEEGVSAPGIEEVDDFDPAIFEIIEQGKPDDPIEAYEELVRNVGALSEPDSHIGGYGWWIQGPEIEGGKLFFAQIHSDDKGPAFGDGGGSVYLVVDAETLKFELSCQCT